MDDHFWPLLYPALIVGSLYGLLRGGWVNIWLGMLGGLAGAVASFFGLAALAITQDLVSFVVLLVSSWLGAVALTSVSRVIRGR